MPFGGSDGSRCGGSASNSRFNRHLARDIARREPRNVPVLRNPPPFESYAVEVRNPTQESLRSFSTNDLFTNMQPGNVRPNTLRPGAHHRPVFSTRDQNISGVFSGRITSHYRQFRAARFPVPESHNSQTRYYSPVPTQRFPSNTSYGFVQQPVTPQYAIVPVNPQQAYIPAVNPRYALMPATNPRYAFMPSSNPTRQEYPSHLNTRHGFSIPSPCVHSFSQRPTSPAYARPFTLGERPTAPARDNNRSLQTAGRAQRNHWNADNLRRAVQHFESNEAPRHSNHGEQSRAIDEQEDFKEYDDVDSETSSELEARFDLAGLDLTEDAEPRNRGRRASARATGASKYLRRLKKIQTQSTEEECDEENGDVQTESEEFNASNRLVQEEDFPGFEEGETPDLNTISRSIGTLTGYLNNLDNTQRYQFREDNPMLDLDNPFEEGLKRLDVGDIPSAVLCFEAAAQIDSENAKVWQYLGTTQAANEQDVHAIVALKECIRLQPDNLTALMALAISYTNEGLESLVVTTLRRWLLSNPKYSDIVSNPPSAGFDGNSIFLNMDAYREVLDFFIQAANRHPTGGDLDPDVQCGLGVMFNLVGDCSKASDCFRAALSVTPEDSRMWNRLGATLANGQRSDEAVEAYYKCLGLNPGYVRARYNLGLSCIHLKFYKEALMHMLKALNQQASGVPFKGLVGEMSNSIWITTKIVLQYMGREDLVPVADNRDLDKLLKEFPV